MRSFFLQGCAGATAQSGGRLARHAAERVRHAPTVAETRALIAAVQPMAGYPTNLVTRLLYGCGLRVSEPLNLRVKNVCFDDGKLFILGGKGRKDRVVALPCSVTEDLRAQLDFARAVWKRDGEANIPLEIPINWG